MNHFGSVLWLLASTGGEVRKLVRAQVSQFLVMAGLTLRNSPESLIHKESSELY